LWNYWLVNIKVSAILRAVNEDRLCLCDCGSIQLNVVWMLSPYRL
jgi:hypothetical protein